MTETINWIKREVEEMPIHNSVLIAGRMRYEWEDNYTVFVDIGCMDADGTVETYNDWYEGQQEFEIIYWAYKPIPPLEIWEGVNS